MKIKNVLRFIFGHAENRPCDNCVRRYGTGVICLECKYNSSTGKYSLFEYYDMNNKS